MDTNISIATQLDKLKSNPMILHSNIPMGYVPGIPVLAIRNEYLCLLVPYLKYQMTGVVDKTLVFPIRYLITLALPESTIVSIEDLQYNPHFSKVQFDKPVGLFRHKAVAHLNKEQYADLKQQLFALYDALVKSLLDNKPFNVANDSQLGQLARILVEPSLKPFYKIIDKDFYYKYLEA